MIGGWPPWRRWLTARRLRRHALRESGPPPPDLLQRLRADIPLRPPVAGTPESSGHRRGGALRPWTLAASLAAAAIAVVIGLRVRENLAGSPAAFSEPLGIAGSDEGKARASSKQDALRPSARQAAPGGANPGFLGRRGGYTAPAAPAAPGPAVTEAPGGAGGAPTGTAGPMAFSPNPRAAPAPPIVDRLADGASAGFTAESAPPAESDGSIGAMRTDAPAAAREPVPAAGAAAVEPAERGRQPLAPSTESDRANRSAERRPPLAKARAQSAPQAPAPAGAPAGQGGALRGLALAAEQPSTAAPPLAAQAASAAAPSAMLRSSFGGSSGSAFYPRLWQELMTEGRLPAPESVRVEELANAFEPAREAAAVSRPRWTVEGAPLTPAGTSYLLRLAARGLAGRPGTSAMQVAFDPAVVTSARRVGANADRNGASALFLVELRPPAAAVAQRAGAASPGRAAETAGAATSRPALESAGAPFSRGAAAGDSVIATLRVSPRAGALTVVGGADAAMTLPARRVRLSELSPSWAPASPALRLQGLAVQLAYALAADTPASRLRLLRPLRGQARSLAAELPGEPKAAALLRLVERAAEVAGVADASAPP